MKLVVGFKPTYKKNRRLDIEVVWVHLYLVELVHYGPSNLLDQNSFHSWAFTYSIFVICHSLVWLVGLADQKYKKEYRTREE